MRRPTNFRRYLAVMLLCLFISILYSQDKPIDYFELSLEELSNIKVITSSKKVESLVETPAYVNVITSDEIRDLNFNTLEEVLEYSTGLATSHAEGNKFPTTTVRGNTISTYNVNTLLLFDGVPVYNPYHGSFNLATIPLSSIDRIEIVKGSNSVLYGTNAINAVINIIPKINETDGSQIEGRAKAGSFRTMTANNAILYKDGDFNVNIYSDFYSTEGQELTYFDQDDGSNFNLRKNLFTGNVASIIEWKGLKIHGQHSRIQNPAIENNSLYELYKYDEDTFNVYIPEISDEYQTLVGASYTHSIIDNMSITAGFSYQDWLLNASSPDLVRIYSSNALRGVVETNLLLLNHTSGIIGFEYNHYRGKRERKGVQNGKYIEKKDVNDNELPTTDIAFYVNGTTKLITEKFGIHYGIRYYFSEYNNIARENVSPRLAFTYSIKNNLAVKFIYGKSFRVPTTFERSSIINTAHGNPNLNPEISQSHDLVMVGTFNGLQWDVDLFHTRISDKIVRVGASDADRIETGLPDMTRWYKNVHSVNYRGIEVNAKYNIKNKIKGLFGYAYVDAETLQNDTTVLGDDPWFYKHMINLGVSYRPINFISATLSAKHLSDFGFGRTGGNNKEYGPLAPAYTVLNLGINIYPVKNKDIRFELKLDNVFDEEILRPEISNRKIDTAPVVPYEFGRRFSVGASYKF